MTKGYVLDSSRTRPQFTPKIWQRPKCVPVPWTGMESASPFGTWRRGWKPPSYGRQVALAWPA